MAVATKTNSAAGARGQGSRPKLLPLADGFVVGSIAMATLRSIGWFAGLFLAFALIQAAKNVATNDVPIIIALESLALQLPRIVLFTIPASLLYGTVATFTEMSSRGEVTALMCGGMSLPRMLRWPIIFSVVLTLVAFWLQEVVVPDFELRKSNLTAQVATAVLENQKFKPLVSYRDDGTLERIVQAEKFDVKNKTIVAPVIQIFRPNFTIETEIKAQRAAWDSARKAWVFYEGSTRSPKENPTNDFDTALSESKEFLVTTDQMPDPDNFEGGEKSAREQLAKSNYEMVSWRQLEAHRDEQRARAQTLSGQAKRDVEKKIRSETYGIHDKFATPLVALAMLLIGAPLGVRPQRTASAGLAMGISLMVILGYYMTWTFCTQWGKGGGQGPVVAAYLPVGLLGLIGIVLLLRKGK